MVCAICKDRKCLKQFVREDMILCYVCRDIYDRGVAKISKSNI
jgi:hypothetical protein